MPEPKRPLKVFLCHARDDKLKTRELYRYLRKRGIRPWLDAEDLVGGQDWRVEIPRAIKTSDAIIICLSKNSINKEGFVQAEITFALEKTLEIPQGRIFIIPVRFEDCEVPNNLERFQWVDLFEENGFPRLMKSLKTRAGQLERSTVQVPQPDESSPNLNSASKDRIESEATLEKVVREVDEKSAHEKAEKKTAEKVRLEVEELERQKTSREKKEHEAIEKDERELKELREKQAREASETANLEAEKQEKVALNKKEKTPVILKPKASRQITYWLGGFAVLVLGMVFLTSINNPSQFSEPTPEHTQLPIIISTHSATSEPKATSTSTPEPTSTFASTLTPTPLPSVIIDTKNVPMALVPAGDFIMGSEDGIDEVKKVNTIFLDAFYIDKYEVTNAFYKDCLSADICSQPKNWAYYSDKFYADHPVVYVTWTQAQVYCIWRGGSLPTEARWEKAARGVDGRTYPWGEEEIDCDKASYRSCNKSDTEEVGKYESGKSPYGIYDMAGNVWELVFDWYDEKYYQYSPLFNPLGPTSGIYHILRGGSWNYRENDLRTYNRRKSTIDNATNLIGFRCAKDAP